MDNMNREATSSGATDFQRTADLGWQMPARFFLCRDWKELPLLDYSGLNFLNIDQVRRISPGVARRAVGGLLAVAAGFL